jgi:methyl-accepting chemotaxis protein
MTYTVLLQEPIRDSGNRSRIALSAASQLGITTQQLEALLGRERDSVIARAGSEAHAQQVANVLSSLGVLVRVVEPEENQNQYATSQEVLSSTTRARRGLGRRILLGALAPLFIAGLALAGYLIATLPGIFDAQLRDRALSAAIAGGVAINETINFALEDAEDLREVKRVIRGMGRQVPAVAFTGVSQGQIIAFESRLQDQEDADLIKDLNERLRKTSIDIRAGGTSTSQTTIFTIKNVPYTVGIVSVGSGQGSSKIFVALKQDRIQADLLRTLVPTILAVLAAIVSTALLAFGLISRIVRPISQLTQKANTMSNGDLEQPIIATSNDEIADLSDALERMRSSLKLMMNRGKRNVVQQ